MNMLTVFPLMDISISMLLDSEAVW